MKKKDFFSQYQTKEWYEISKRIKARDNNTCQMCGCNDKPLSVHHLCYRKGNILDNSDDELITLCEDCHEYQNFCKGEAYGYFELLRSVLTDFELERILGQLYFDVTSPMPSYYHDLEPTRKYLFLFEEKNQEYAKNLMNWRKKIRLKEIKAESIRLWRDPKNRTQELRQWYKSTFGEDLEDVAKKSGCCDG